MGPTYWYKRFATYFRPSRMEVFCRTFDVTTKTRILDVGGEPEIWGLLPFCPKVTLVNLGLANDANGFAYLKADARNLPLEDKSFDICFSNSMIEHLWTLEDQQKAANEIRRVGKHYFVQTPNFWFPIEPHFLAPFFHWLPLKAREKIFSITPSHSMYPEHSRSDWLQLVHELRLLTHKDLQNLFPEASIKREKFGGITKSLIAVH
jgi:ubiquinone/menaquinone biosynthesis C-methylase UbiE